MVLPVAALGLRGLAGLLGRSGAGKGMQSAMGRALGNKKIMPFAGKTPGVNPFAGAKTTADINKIMAAEKRKALLTALGIGGAGGVAAGGLTQLLLNLGSEDEMDVRRPALMGINEPNLTVEDLVMRGDTNEPVRTGPDNEGYLTRGEMEVDPLTGKFIKPQDRMPDSGEVDLLKLLGLR